LFGSTTNATSAFGNTSTAPAQTAQTPSFFGQSQPQVQQPAQPSLLGQPQPQASTAQAPGQASTQGTQPAFFNSLLERGKKRPLAATVQSGNFEDVPSLQLGLDDIRRKARELGTLGTKDSLQNGTATKA
jgi:nuclear pore complex protein Nup93